MAAPIAAGVARAGARREQRADAERAVKAIRRVRRSGCRTPTYLTRAPARSTRAARLRWPGAIDTGARMNSWWLADRRARLHDDWRRRRIRGRDHHLGQRGSRRPVDLLQEHHLGHQHRLGHPREDQSRTSSGAANIVWGDGSGDRAKDTEHRLGHVRRRQHHLGHASRLETTGSSASAREWREHHLGHPTTTTSSGAPWTRTTSSGAPTTMTDNIIWGTWDGEDNIIWGNLGRRQASSGAPESIRQHRLGHTKLDLDNIVSGARRPDCCGRGNGYRIAVRESSRSIARGSVPRSQRTGGARPAQFYWDRRSRCANCGRPTRTALLAAFGSPEVTRLISPPPPTLDGLREVHRVDAAAARRRSVVRVRDYPQGQRYGRRPVPGQGAPAGVRHRGMGFCARRGALGQRPVSSKPPELVLDFVFDVVGVHRLEARAALKNGRGNGAPAEAWRDAGRRPAPVVPAKRRLSRSGALDDPRRRPAARRRTLRDHLMH